MLPGGIVSIVLLIIIFETFALGCIKKHHDGDGSKFLLLAILLYAFIAILMSNSLDYYTSITTISVICAGASVFIITLAGIFLYEEELEVSDILSSALIAAGVMVFQSSN